MAGLRDAVTQPVRTTITLDPDTRMLVERMMRERGVSFTEAVNKAGPRGSGS
jgi:hypothetical protein